MSDARSVLAVSLEAAEARIIRRLMARGDMPVLAALAERSSWLAVAPETYVGSVPLWPSFNTGLGPEEHHRLYGPWIWDTEQMRIVPQDFAPLVPLWAGSVDAPVGLLDVPGVARSAPPGGFAVRGWGSHNPMEREYTVDPGDAEPLVGDRHPFECSKEINYKTGNRVREFTRLSTDALRGIGMRGAAGRRLLRRFRPELTIVNFPELHRGGHWLWHTLEPDDPHFAGLPEEVREMPVTLPELYREADRQLGVLVDEAGPQADVFVFAFNGMGPANGICDLLRPVLTGAGYARIADLRPGSVPRRTFAAVKARTPASLKRAYYGLLPEDLTLRSAQMLPDYDWSATRAFAMPSEQHGWIRLNVAGREAAGIVDPGAYERTCDELEAMLRSLTSPSGEPLVHEIARTGADDVLPDLVVFWTAAADGEVARLDGREFRAPRIVPWLVGQHTNEGFCLAPPHRTGGRARIAPVEMQQLMLDPG